MIRNVKILGRRYYSPTSEDVASLEDAQLTDFSNFPLDTFVSKMWLGRWKSRRQHIADGERIVSKCRKITACLVANLHPSDLVNTIFHLVF